MGATWDADDNDLEKLLEFDDVDVDPAPRPGRQAPLLRPTLQTLPSPLEVGGIRPYPDAGRPKPSAEQIQVTRRGRGGSDVRLDNCERECLEDLPPSLPGTDVRRLSPSLKRGREQSDEDGGRENMQDSRGSSMHHDLTANLKFSKQMRCEIVSQDLRGAQRTENELESGDKLSHGEFDRREHFSNGAAGGGLSSSKGAEFRDRGTDNRGRSRESDRTGEGRDQRQKSRGLAEDGRSSQLVVSLSCSAARGAGEDGDRPGAFGMHVPRPSGEDPSERKVFPPPSDVKRRIPGPAGALQEWLRSNSNNSSVLNGGRMAAGPSRTCYEALVAADTLEFRDGPWLAAMEYLNDGQAENGDQPPRSTIATVRATNRPIPQIVAVIKEVVSNAYGDLSVSLKDPTGVIKGNIHNTVFTNLDGAQLITPRAAIILQKVSVFSPTPYVHYLTITANNVAKIFGKDTVAVRSGANASTSNTDLGGRSRRIVSQRDRNTQSRLPRASQKGHAFQAGEGSSEAVTNGEARRQSHGIGRVCGEAVDEEHLPNHRASGLNAATVKTPPESSAILKAPDQPESLTAAVDVRHVQQRDIKDPVDDCQAKASQEAIAKAAGWDFSEDFELLEDDFPLAKF